jgi:hypothetical protein
MKGNVAGEAVRSEPRNQTSVRFRSSAMVKRAILVGNIPWSGAENQMKLSSGRSLYHKEPPRCGLSDGITMSQQAKIITGLCCISYSYLHRSSHVKLNPIGASLNRLGTRSVSALPRTSLLELNFLSVRELRFLASCALEFSVRRSSIGNAIEQIDKHGPFIGRPEEPAIARI